MPFGYIVDVNAWPANDDILPDNYDIRAVVGSRRPFFIKLTVEFKFISYPEALPCTTRVFHELFVPRDNNRGLAREAWDLIQNSLAHMGTPANAFAETVLQLTCCALQMVRDPANFGRLVLPMEAVITCVDQDDEPEIEDVVDIEEVVVDKTDQECSVCLAAMEEGSVASRLPCMHEFHSECINEWFKHDITCPLCRTEY